METQMLSPNDAATANSAIASFFDEEPVKTDKKDPDKEPDNKKDEPPETDSLFDDSEPGKKVDSDNPFEKLAMDYGIEFDEDEKADPEIKWDYDLLKTKLDRKFEESQKKLNLDEFDPDSRKVIEYFTEKGGSLVDFYKNQDLADVEKLKAMSDEDLWKNNAINKYVQMGFTELEALNRAEADIDSLGDRRNQIFKNFGDTARNNLDEFAKEKIQEIIDERNKFIEANNQKANARAAAERANMIKELKKFDSFMGVRLGDKDKEFVAKEIESGRFLEKIEKNPAQAQLFSYLSLAIGPKIIKVYESVIQNKEDAAKNRAIIKFLTENFNAIPKEQSQPKGSGGGFNLNDPKQANDFLNTILPSNV